MKFCNSDSVRGSLVHHIVLLSTHRLDKRDRGQLVDHLVAGALQWSVVLVVGLGGSPPVSLRMCHCMQPSGVHHIKRIMSKMLNQTFVNFPPAKNCANAQALRRYLSCDHRLYLAIALSRQTTFGSQALVVCSVEKAKATAYRENGSKK